MEEKTCCLQGRFCWQKTGFSSWSDVVELAKPFCLIPYRGWLAPMLVGDGERFLEVWQRDDAGDLIGDNIIGVWKKDGAISLARGKERNAAGSPEGGNVRLNGVPVPFEPFAMPLKTFERIEDAVNELFLFLEDPRPFHPTSVYSKGDGLLQSILEDPESVAMVISTWKRYAHWKNSREYEPVLAYQNRSSAQLFFPNTLCMSKEEKKILREREEQTCLTNYTHRYISLRCGAHCNDLDPLKTPCWKYDIADYRSDGWLIVVDKNISEEDLNRLKCLQMEYAAANDIDFIFVKEKKACYGLGCRAEEEYRPIAGSSSAIRFLRNQWEKVPLQGATATESLFKFLTKLYNLDYAVIESREESPHFHVPYIDEEIERSDIKRCGSFNGAVMFYSSNAPVRRSQWARLENPQFKKDHKYQSISGENRI